MSERIFKQYSLGFYFDQERVLLGIRKKSWGRGLFNGFGGKVNPNESTEASLVRELKEEIGIDVLDSEKRGIVFYKDDIKQTVTELHIYKINKFKGEAREIEEMEPKWFFIKNIPYDKLFPGTELWINSFINNEKFVGEIEVKNKEVIYSKIEKVKDLEERLCTIAKRYIMC